ncbi:endoplasmic reticulum mannosyl-oligosaccharide 1,2-alpha-mannosidase [Podospora fimiseda]|uniref:alpha-1,2-Mannosidase n=1 Tax=Podospora fimiseda TaxID=252190 RepID=A0AAN7BTP7_9PEZI|nr:endoplasmic reticulum mannosyl-oligosaccharide 1,2-alpha-mannosidase [Podospora fimiseda]
MTSRRRLARLFLIAIVIYLVILFLFTAFQETAPPQQQKGDGKEQTEIIFKPSSFDWTTIKPHHPIPPPLHTFSKPTPLKTKIQHDSFKHYHHSTLTHSRQQAIRSAFLKSWNLYTRHAFGADELTPISLQPKQTFGGLSATLIDSLDTLFILNLTQEFYSAAAYAVQLDLDSSSDTSLNLFETTIRHLGGLVSAYELSLEPGLLKKAQELGNMLLLAFDTPNGMPGFWFDFRKGKTGHLVAGVNEPSAAVGSLSLEFTRLSLLTGDNKYRERVERVMGVFERSQEEGRVKGIWPKMMNFRVEEERAKEAVEGEGAYTLGALADSLYEYLVKMVGLIGEESKEGEKYKKMYLRAAEVIEREMVFKPMVEENSLGKAGKGGVLFVGDLYVDTKGEKSRIYDIQHLTCFSGGMFALGGKMFEKTEYVELGEKLGRGCAWAYEQFDSGIMPEISTLVGCDSTEEGKCEWDEEKWKKEARKTGLPKGFVNAQDTRYILRPEAIESIFILYRITGKEEFRDIAWRMWESIVEATGVEGDGGGGAFSAIGDVTVGKGGGGDNKKLDSMESFWFAETLKYFYLVFSPPDLISLDEWVFNTEAHPFRRPRSERE